MNRKLLSAAIMGAVMASAFAGSAQADDWHDHEVRAYHHWHPRPHAHPVVVEPAPVVYAPPVVMAPPPPPEGINLILPLHFN